MYLPSNFRPLDPQSPRMRFPGFIGPRAPLLPPSPNPNPSPTPNSTLHKRQPNHWPREYWLITIIAICIASTCLLVFLIWLYNRQLFKRRDKALALEQAERRRARIETLVGKREWEEGKAWRESVARPEGVVRHGWAKFPG